MRSGHGYQTVRHTDSYLPRETPQGAAAPASGASAQSTWRLAVRQPPDTVTRLLQGLGSRPVGTVGQPHRPPDQTPRPGNFPAPRRGEEAWRGPGPAHVDRCVSLVLHTGPGELASSGKAAPRNPSDTGSTGKEISRRKLRKEPVGGLNDFGWRHQTTKARQARMLAGPCVRRSPLTHRQHGKTEAEGLEPPSGLTRAAFRVRCLTS